MTTEPSGELDPRYSAEGVEPAPWSRAIERLTTAELAHLTTLRLGGQPRVTPVNLVRVGERLFVHTGPHEPDPLAVGGVT